MEKMVESLLELIRIESIATRTDGEFPYGEGPAKALEYVLNLCDSFGFRTKNAGWKYGYAEIGEGEDLICILVHLDVVPAGKGWSYPPFKGTIDGNRIYGRGTIDDKGPAIACIYAMKDLLDEGRALNKRIRIIFGQTEENGEWTDLEEYKANEEMPSYGFTPDGDFPAIYCEKGIMLVTISMDKEKSGFLTLSGGNAPNAVPDNAEASLTASEGTLFFQECGKASHGCAPWLGDNAITKLMVKINEKYPQLPFVKMYMAAVGDSCYGEAMNINLSDNESGRLSMNAGMIKDDGKKLTLYLDIRYPVTFSSDYIMEIINSGMSDFSVDVELVHHMKPVYLDRESDTMKKLLSAYQNVTGDNSKPLVIGGGTYARSMDNIIAFGPNIPNHENREHREDEYILIEDFEAIRLIYKKALENYVYVSLN